MKQKMKFNELRLFCFKFNEYENEIESAQNLFHGFDMYEKVTKES